MKITTLPLIFLSIDDDGMHIMVKGLINGLPANFIVDTGASRSVFDQVGIKKYIPDLTLEENEKLSSGLGTNTMPSHVTVIESITLGQLVVSDYSAILIDLTHVHQSYRALQLPEINGVLGGDLLWKYRAAINYKAQTLKLSYAYKSDAYLDAIF